VARELEVLREETKAAGWKDLLEEIKRASVEKKLVILDLLKDVDDPSIMPALVSYLSIEKNEFVLAEIIKILGLIGKEEIIPILIEKPHAEGPFGAKGLGETALIPAPPAIANAIEDAVGVRITDLPITPERVFLAIQRKREEQSAQAHLTKS